MALRIYLAQELNLSLIIPAGFLRLCSALVNYHAGLYPEAAESVIAASGLHTQKPQCSSSTITTVSSTASAMQTQRWVPVTYSRDTPDSTFWVENSGYVPEPPLVKWHWMRRCRPQMHPKITRVFKSVHWDSSWLRIMGLPMMMMMMPVNWAPDQTARTPRMCAGQSGFTELINSLVQDY